MSDQPSYTRKGFFGEFFSLFKKGVTNHVERKIAKKLDAPLRPPGALDEIEFLSTCTRCNACAEACPHFAIQRMPVNAGVAANTPYIEPRTRACMLCPDFPCIAACGDQALLPVAGPSAVRMGIALVNPEACQTYDDKVCTLCYDACPYPEQAIEIGSDLHPRVLDACTGCGLCERSCPVTPIGIKVLSPMNYRVARMDEDLYFGLFTKEDDTE